MQAASSRRARATSAKIALVLAGLAAVTLAAPLAAQDVVELQDGTTLEGRVVFEDARRLVLRIGSRERELEVAKVASVRSRMRALRQALELWEKIETEDVQAMLDVARFCRSKGLEGEARVFAYRVLAVDPHNEDAHALGGHEKHRDDWIVREGRKRRAFPEPGGTRDWGDAWMLETTHYRLATNLDLASACDLAIELELFYRAFFSWFGADLELYDVVKPMATQVHADKESYPDANGRVAYFDGSCNVLYELAVEGLVLDVLVHEATHQILHNTTAETRSGRGDVPAWLHEGLAEYMAGCRQGAPAHARYDERFVFSGHFLCHREARKPYDLGRILTLAPADFLASSKSDLKYAQSYTLVHFLLHGQDGAHRVAFGEFLRSVYRGRSSSSDFKEALKVKERVFEKEWLAYVERTR